MKKSSNEKIVAINTNFEFFSNPNKKKLLNAFSERQPVFIPSAITDLNLLMNKEQFEDSIGKNSNSWKFSAMKELDELEIQNRERRDIPNLKNLTAQQAKTLREAGMNISVTDIQLSDLSFAKLLIQIEELLNNYCYIYETKLIQTGPTIGYGITNQMNDIISIQIHGSKAWRFARKPLSVKQTVNFIAGRGYIINDGAFFGDQVGVDASEDLYHEVELKPGDLLYLPSWTLHSQSSDSDYNLDFSIFRFRQSKIQLLENIFRHIHSQLNDYEFCLDSFNGLPIEDLRKSISQNLSSLHAQFQEIDPLLIQEALIATSYKYLLEKKMDLIANEMYRKKIS